MFCKCQVKPELNSFEGRHRGQWQTAKEYLANQPPGPQSCLPCRKFGQQQSREKKVRVEQSPSPPSRLQKISAGWRPTDPFVRKVCLGAETEAHSFRGGPWGAHPEGAWEGVRTGAGARQQVELSQQSTRLPLAWAASPCKMRKTGLLGETRCPWPHSKLGCRPALL